MSAGHRPRLLASGLLALAVAACSSSTVTPAAVEPLRIPGNLPADDPADTSTDTMPELDSTTRDPFDAWDHTALAEATDTSLGEGGGLAVVPGGDLFGSDSPGTGYGGTYGGSYGSGATDGRPPGGPGGTLTGGPTDGAPPGDGRAPGANGWRPLWPARDAAEDGATDGTATDTGDDGDRDGADDSGLDTPGRGRAPGRIGTRPPADEPPPVAREQAELIEVSAIINLGGGHRATIRSRRTGQERQVRAGDPVGEWQVETIDDDGLTLRLRAGKLQQRVPFQPGGLPSGIVFGAGRAEPFQP